MMVHPALGRRMMALSWPLAGIGALTILLLSPDIRSLVTGALAHVSLLAVLVALPGQAMASLLCGAALFVLRPGVTLRASVVSRLLRDAGANLLLFMPGLGEIIGARALVLAGGRARTAITAVTLDNFAETLAQLPFAALVLVVLQRGPRVPVHLSVFAMEGLPWIALAFVALTALLVIGASTSARGQRAWRRLAARIRAELALLKQELGKQGRGFPAAIALHFCAWAMGGVQIWMIARALAIHLNLFPAIVIESVAYAGRAIAFFVPAGLAIQEAALVFAGLAYALRPPEALAIALVLRLRDLVFGLPLLLWPLFEFRRRVEECLVVAEPPPTAEASL